MIGSAALLLSASLLVLPSETAAGEAAGALAATVTAGEDGFSLRSADGDFVLRLRSLVQADGRFYSGDGPAADGFLMRRASLEITGIVYERFDFRLMPDFAGSSTTLLDAWLRWKVSPAFQVQVGKVKLPVGLEREQSRENNLFNELGYPTALVPNRDVGVNVQGQLAGGAASYYVGVFNGTSDGGSVVSDTDDRRELAARLFVTPFRKDAAKPKLALGVAGTHGSREGTPSEYRTVGQQTFFRWRSGVVEDGTTWRVVPQLYYYRGPFGLLSEYALSSHELRLAAESRDVDVSAWTVNASWVLTGEDATFQGVTPSRPIGGQGGRGAWQVTVRATGLEVDEDAFPVLADPSQAARRASTLGIGVNWYLNKAIRFSADYHHTDLDDGGALGEERAVILRAQLRY